MLTCLGILRRPHGIPYDCFAEECRFFQLPEVAILSAKPKDFKGFDHAAPVADEDKEEY